MIEIRSCDAGKRHYVLFCPDCEEKYGIKCELEQDYSDRSKDARSWRSKRLKDFEDLHSHGETGEDFEYQLKIMRDLRDQFTIEALLRYFGVVL